jgi:hypothetical protein
MKPTCKPIGLKNPPFKRVDQDKHQVTGEGIFAQVAAQSTWRLALVGLAVVVVVGGATAGVVVAVNSNVSPPPSPPPILSPPPSTSDAQRGMTTPDVSMIARANGGRRLETSRQQVRSSNNGGRRLAHTHCLHFDTAECNLRYDGFDQAYNEIRVALFAPCLFRRLRTEQYVGQGLQNVTELEYDERCVATSSTFTVDAECINSDNICPFSANISGKFNFTWRERVNNGTKLNALYLIEAEESNNSFGEFSIAANYALGDHEESMNLHTDDGVVTMIKQHGVSNDEMMVNKIVLEKRGSTASDTYALQGTSIYSATFRSYTAPSANFTSADVDAETPTYVVAFLSSSNDQTVCVKRDYTMYADQHLAALGCSSGCFTMMLSTNNFTVDAYTSSDEFDDSDYSRLRWPAGACTSSAPPNIPPLPLLPSPPSSYNSYTYGSYGRL